MSTHVWISAVLATVAVVAEAAAETVPLREIDHTTEVTLVVDASPEEIYDVVTDYANWRQIFTDVTDIRVLSGGRDDAKVRFKSRALRSTVTVQFHNDPGKAIRFRGVEGPPGGRAHGEYLLTPVGDGTRTQVTARLYMDVKGPAGLFVRDKQVREMRRLKVSTDLNDALRWMARRRQ